MSEFDFLKDFGRHLDRERPQENQEETGRLSPKHWIKPISRFRG